MSDGIVCLGLWGCQTRLGILAQFYFIRIAVALFSVGPGADIIDEVVVYDPYVLTVRLCSN